MTRVAYRGEGHVIQPGCTMQAHYAQIQAMCDAMGFAAQRQQAGFIEKYTNIMAAAADGTWAKLGFTDSKQCLVAAVRADQLSHYWYGVFQGYRGLLRALEGNVGELHAVEREMLDRIDWDTPHFVVPGFEHVKLEDQHLPGEGK